MSRPKLSPQTEASVLTQCRRRCCLCYGLNADSRVKHGQIAHIDRSPSNNKIDNLAFLCFDHHDQYDSKTSQSKGLTSSEVKFYQKELFDHISKIWNSIVPKEVSIDLVSGLYLRSSEITTAELELTLVNDHQVKVKGFALYGKTSPMGPNIGDLDFVSFINNNKIHFEDNVNGKRYIIDIELLGDMIKVKERYEPSFFAYFGVGVSFNGTLAKQDN